MRQTLVGTRSGRHDHHQNAQQAIANEKGAEVVEWVLWVRGIAILAGTLYTIMSGTLTNTVTNIVGGIKGVGSW